MARTSGLERPQCYNGKTWASSPKIHHLLLKFPCLKHGRVQGTMGSHPFSACISSHQLRESLALIVSKHHWRQSKVIGFTSHCSWLRHRPRAVVPQLRGNSSYTSSTQSHLNGWTYHQFKSLWQSKPEMPRLGPQQTNLRLNNYSSLSLIPGETISKTSLRSVDDPAFGYRGC